MKASEKELLEIIIELWETPIEKEGRTPERKDLKLYGYCVSGDTVVRKFGSWKKALMRAYDYESSGLDDHHITQQVALDDKHKRKQLSLRKRFFVMKRDSFSCAKCRASGSGVRLEVDHIIPHAKGGSDALDNLQTLCFDCNRGKRDDYEL
jgi:HNH endonuclease